MKFEYKISGTNKGDQSGEKDGDVFFLITANRKEDGSLDCFWINLFYSENQRHNPIDFIEAMRFLACLMPQRLTPHADVTVNAFAKLIRLWINSLSWSGCYRLPKLIRWLLYKYTERFI